MATFKILRRENGNFYIYSSGTNFFVNTSGNAIDLIPLPISGFNYTMQNYNNSDRCETVPGLTELCCDNPGDSSIEWEFNVPANEDEVKFYIIRRVLTESIRNTSGTYAEGYLPGYSSPWCAFDSGVLGSDTTTITNFEPFVVTSTSGTGETFSAASEYANGSSFYHDTHSGDDCLNSLGISKIEFSKQFGPKITFRSPAAKFEFVDVNNDMYLVVSNSGLFNRAYVGKHVLLNSRISNQTDTTVSYSGIPVTMSGIDELLEDLENNPSNTFLYIQMEYDYADLLVDNCDNSETINSPLVLSKYFADSVFRNGSKYNVNLNQNPSCSYHSYQVIAVNEHGQSLQKPNDIVTMSTYESGWIFKGNQEWSVSDDGGSNLIFQWGAGADIGFSGLCPAEIGYFFNGGSNPSCPGINGPFASAAECSQAQSDCGIFPPTICFNQQLSVTLEYVSGILYSRDNSNVYEASSATPGYISMPAPPNGWYEFKGIEGRYVEDPSGNINLCEQDTKKCSGGGLNLIPYDGWFYVYDGKLVEPSSPFYPVVN